MYLINNTDAPRLSFIVQTTDGSVVGRDSESSTTISIIGTLREVTCLKDIFGGNSSDYTLTLVAETTPFTKVAGPDSNLYFEIER